ncbi:MAG: response regulator transcription factor [Rhodospirillales bacterium]|nr:response regulator transcription factor [Rhodospirillales bacterium]
MNRTGPIEVVVADKSPLILNALEQIFSGDERFSLVANASDGERFLEAVDRLAFDVGVIGWVMPYLDGAGVLKAIASRPRAPKIVIYTGDPGPDLPRRAMLLGAAGFCSKREKPEILLSTVQAVAEGRMVFPFMDMSKPQTDPFASLTVRERDLFGSLAQGLTNAQIAKALGVSLNTVKFHLKNLYEKLGVSNRAQAVAYYMKWEPPR